MGSTRFVSNFSETPVREGRRIIDTEIAFDLVVRDEQNVFTYGGGRVRVLASAVETDELLEAALEEAVEAIRAKGDRAYPKDTPEPCIDDCEMERRLWLIAKERNMTDRPTRRDPFGGR